MKCFFSYLKQNCKWFMLIAACGMMMAAVLLLNEIAMAEILYGLLLCAAFLVVVMGVDFFEYQKKYGKLLELEKTITVELSGMPRAAGVQEEAYQTLAQELFEEKNRLENEGLRRERDLMEYYTMWVHQIKTPIAALRLLLQEETDVDGEETTDREEELQELFRIEQYVEMALQYMRLGSETTDFVLREVALDGIIREAVHKYARQFIRRKVSLRYDAVKQAVITDEKWLEFVIEQLLSNAIKYTPKGSIAIRMEESRLIIEDTGIGIRAEDLPRVCEKGYTGYNGHADKRSTGIGLYLCSSILKKLGHTFTITSEEGVGTRVGIGFE